MISKFGKSLGLITLLFFVQHAQATVVYSGDNGVQAQVFTPNCSGCHNADTVEFGQPNWQDYLTARSNIALIIDRVITQNNMPPPSGGLAAGLKTLLQLWDAPAGLPEAELAPTMTTVSATGIGKTSATLNGSGIPHCASTTVDFQYGINPSFTNSTSTTSIGNTCNNSTTETAYNRSATGLLCSTTYIYRARGTSTAGIGNGSSLTFGTSACTSPSITNTSGVAFGASTTTSMTEDVPGSFSFTVRSTADVDGLETLAWDFTTTPGVNGTVSYGGSATASTGPGVNRTVTFTPTANFSGSTSFTIRVRDNTNLSTLSDTLLVNVTVDPVNDAPVLDVDNSSGATFLENAVTGTIIDSTISLSDVVAEGNSITGATVSITGNFQSGDFLDYTNINGITGSYDGVTGVLTLSGTNTLAVYADTLETIRYRSTSNNPTQTGTTRTISFAVTDNGTPTPAASNTDTATVTITPVNDAPALDVDNSSGATYLENAVTGAIIDATIGLTDHENNSITGAIVSITGNFSSAQDRLDYSTVNGITGLYDIPSGVLTLSGTTTLANYAAALQTIRYRNVSDNPTTSRTISFTVTDNGTPTPAPSNTDTAAVTITPVNDGPALSGVDNTPVYTEGTNPGVIIDGSISVSDAESDNCNQATIDLSTNYLDTEDVLEYTTSLPGAITSGSFDSVTGTFTFSGSSACSDYVTALQNVRYRNTSLNPDTNARTVVFQLQDVLGASGNSQPTTITVSALSTAPTVSDVDNVATYVENDTAGVVIDSSITITDPDSANINRATVTITPGTYNAAQDQLLYSPALHGVTVTSNTGGVLTLDGVATKAQYEEVLESVRYRNASENPNPAGNNVRTIEFSVRDTSNVSAITPDSTLLGINVTNDVPVIDVDNSSAANYTENDVTGVIIDSTIAIADGEANSITGATVTITTNFNSGQDLLVYSTVNGITGAYNVPSPGVLTLSGTATLAQYEQALESVRYRNTSDNPSTGARTISFAVTDNGINITAGSSSPAPQTSAADTSSVAITATNDAPAIDVDNSSAANYIENGPAVVIDSTITIVDLDTADLIDSAIVGITGNFNSAEDQLIYVDTPSITGSYDNNAGVLTLTGAATRADYELALESVAYRNNSDVATVLTRTISFAVRDTGTPNQTSAADVAVLTINVVNDAPNAVDDNYNVAVNSVNNTLNVLANDTDIDPGDNLALQSVTAVTNAPGAVLTVGDGGACPLNTVCYTPAPNFTNFFVFTYTIVDDHPTDPLTDTATVTVGGTDSDGDGDIDFLDNCPSVPNAGQENNDGDSQGDVCDDDDDNDGMTDVFENLYDGVNGCELDPFDATDGTEDCDGDGLSNADEEPAGKDPTLDDVGPIFSGTETITVDAIGYLTPVNISVTALDGAQGSMAITLDSVTGPGLIGTVACGVFPVPVICSEVQNNLFRPGLTQITRITQDSLGNDTTSTQSVNVRPLANFQPDQIVDETGHWAYVSLYLNGDQLPGSATVDYSVSGTSNNPADHTAQNGTVSFIAGFGGINIYLKNDGIADNNETIVLTLSNPVNVTLGGRRVHTITIAEGNIAPTVSLSLQQGTNEGSPIITNPGGTVIVTATAPDPNPGNILSYSWSSDPVLAQTNATGGPTFEFDSTGLAAGLYSVTVRVSDNAGAVVESEILMTLQDAAPVLSAVFDADSDGINDALDGYDDGDGDGIPNYLDAYEQGGQGNLVQNQVGDSNPASATVQLQNVKLLQTETGFRIRKGPTAVYSNVSGTLVIEDDIMDYADANAVPRASANDAMRNVGGIYDFEIFNMQPGATARVVLPLSARILENSVYRKFSLRNGWRDFVTNSNNAIGSTRSLQGVCPAPGHSSYRSGLNVFDDCVQLTLQDGGPNDADGAANGVIRDPGGVAVVDPAPAPVQTKPRDGGGGGLLHPLWLLLLVLWNVLRTVRRRQIGN